nr:PREDICTED: uncharacterized protein LOC109032433 [Bemisia tabaci]
MVQGSNMGEMINLTLRALLLFMVNAHSFSSSTVSLNGRTAGRDGSQVPKSDAKHTRFTALELQCFAKEQVSYGDSCYSLLERGPCNKGEWLVLDLESAILEEPQLTAVCAEKQCNNNDIFWPQDGFCYNVTEGESSLCPERNTLLHVDPFGEGVCDCKPDKPYVRWFRSRERRSFQCFEVYTRGPCRQGYVVVKKGAQVSCEEDPCRDFQKEGAQYVFWEDDGVCYKLGSRGPCLGKNKLMIDQETKAPACASSFTNPLVLIELPPINKSCKTDHAGNCVEEIKISNVGDRFTKNLIQIADEKKRKQL